MPCGVQYSDIGDFIRPKYSNDSSKTGGVEGSSESAVVVLCTVFHHSDPHRRNDSTLLL